MALGDTKYKRRTDSYGYRWLVFQDSELKDMVVAIGNASGSLASLGLKDNLLCAVFAFGDKEGQPTYLIYVFKEGSFYPFIPKDAEKKERDLQKEFLLSAKLQDRIPIESDHSKWFPLWGTPLSDR